LRRRKKTAPPLKRIRRLLKKKVSPFMKKGQVVWKLMAVQFKKSGGPWKKQQVR
jgi:hypothetical protein